MPNDDGLFPPLFSPVFEAATLSTYLCTSILLLVILSPCATSDTWMDYQRKDLLGTSWVPLFIQPSHTIVEVINATNVHRKPTQGYQTVGCFQTCLEELATKYSETKFVKIIYRDCIRTSQIGMFLQYWCTTIVLSKGLVSVCRSLLKETYT